MSTTAEEPAPGGGTATADGSAPADAAAALEPGVAGGDGQSVAAEPDPPVEASARPSRRHRLVPWAIAAALLPVYLVISISRYGRLLTASPDLAIFEQAIQGYSRFGAPIVDVKSPGYNLLGDHFHPLLALMGPFYRVFPSPVTLLVLQALLVAVSIVPVTRAAQRRLGTGPAVCLGLAYGWSWGLQSAIDFDFHEICMAVPILAFALEALLERRWWLAASLSLLLLGVKEDLPITVAAVGLVLVLRRQWWLGLGLGAVGLGSFWLIVWKIIPAFNPDGVYAYGFAIEGGSDHAWWQLPVELVWPGTKLATLAYLLGIVGFVALRSPVLLVALPTIAWRFHSDPAYWGTNYQYSAVLMPVVFLACIEVLHAWRERGRPWQRAYGAHVPAVALAVAIALTPSFPFANLVRASFWQDGAHVAGARAAMSLIPDGATVQANVGIQPQLVHRTRLTFPGETPDGADFIVIDKDWDSLDAQGAQEWVEQTYPEETYTLAYSDGRFTVLRREDAPAD
ncbi:MAG: DUF2079 domain-containing protein [Kineosporiaceae bacterium]